MRHILLTIFAVLLFQTSHAQVARSWGLQSIGIEQAWQAGLFGAGEPGKEVIVAILGGGVEVNHPLLGASILQNPGEIGNDEFGIDKRINGRDDDGNNYPDDWAGYNVPRRSGPRIEIPFHELETQVAGIIAGQHRDANRIEDKVQGIAPGAKILPVTFMDQFGRANPAHILEAIDYAVLRGAKIICAPWNLGQDFPGLREKILSLGQAGVLFVSSAGNMNQNIDALPIYPGSYNFDRQITVGAHRPVDFQKVASSGFGQNSVHLMAPGEEILTTSLNGQVSELSGAAAATAYVAGVAAVLWAAYPQATVTDISDAILLGTTQETVFDGLTWTEGRLSFPGAMQQLDSFFQTPAQVAPTEGESTPQVENKDAMESRFGPRAKPRVSKEEPSSPGGQASEIQVQDLSRE